jgi:hypothetical protein
VTIHPSAIFQWHAVCLQNTHHLQLHHIFTQALNFLKTGATVTNTMTTEAEVSASVAKYYPEAGRSTSLENLVRNYQAETAIFLKNIIFQKTS